MNIKLTINQVPGDITLDEKCWNCDENGITTKKGIGDEGDTCCICKGKAYQLTNAGEAIMFLLERHGKK